MASLFPSPLQIGQLPDADPNELDVDEPIKSSHATRFRDRDEHIMSGLLDGTGAAFDLNVNNLTVQGALSVPGSFDFPEKALLFFFY